MKTGRVCEVHSEYCPTGDCRWCGIPVRNGPNGRRPYGWTDAERAATARSDAALNAPAGFDIPADAVLAGFPMGSRCIMPPEIAAHYRQASINFRTEAPGALRIEISCVDDFSPAAERLYVELWRPLDGRLTDDRTAKDCESPFSGLARFRGHPEKQS